MISASIAGQDHIRCASAKSALGDVLGTCYLEIQAPDLPDGIVGIRRAIHAALETRVEQFGHLLHSAERMLVEEEGEAPAVTMREKPSEASPDL